MSFKKNNFFVIKQAIDKELCNFLYSYMEIRKQAFDYLQKTRFLSPYDDSWGCMNDGQIPNTYSVYGDPAYETLLVILKDKIEDKSGFDLVEQYSYARRYKNGDVLARHTDREECTISATLHLGGDEWPIYLDASGRVAQAGIKINLKAGDLLMYKGDKMEHYREEFTGDNSSQVFLHYNEIPSTKKFDTRPMVGLPSEFKKDKDEFFPNN